MTYRNAWSPFSWPGRWLPTRLADEASPTAPASPFQPEPAVLSERVLLIPRPDALHLVPAIVEVPVPLNLHAPARLRFAGFFAVLGLRCHRSFASYGSSPQVVSSRPGVSTTGTSSHTVLVSHSICPESSDLAVAILPIRSVVTPLIVADFPREPGPRRVTHP